VREFEMSGGDLDYVYFRLQETVRLIREKICYIPKENRARILKFCDHLELVAKALHNVEWVIGGDYGADGADAAIDAVLRGEKC
jgi:hypothetical protein